MEIIKANDDSIFNFKRINLANPEPYQNNIYFTKISLEDNKPFYIQLPKCKTKQGLIDSKGSKYCDLMYDRNSNEELVSWLEKLEYSCQDKLDEKKELWFQTELTRDDIESMMSPIMRVYQSGKFILIRISLNTNKLNGNEMSIAYNEQETRIDLEKLEASDSIIPLLLINGIKFSSRSFEIDVKLSQMMIFDKPSESSCLIKNTKNDNDNDNDNDNSCDTLGKLDNNTKENINIVINDNNNQKDKLNSLGKESLFKKEALIGKRESIIETTINSEYLDSDGVLENKPTRSSKIDNKLISIENNTKTENQKTKDEDILEVINVTIDDPTSLEEVSINYENIEDTINLKNPNEVYYEIYKKARTKAKDLRKVAMDAYLEAKEIKTKYMLSDSEESEDDNISDSDSDNDNDNDNDIEDLE